MAASNMEWYGLRLDALDTLFFRDGRPFDPANRVVSGLPTPQTLAGAIRTALLARTGFDFGTFRKLRRKRESNIRETLVEAGAKPEIINAAIRGPWLAIVDDPNDMTASPLMAMPETLRPAKDGNGWSIALPQNDVPGWPSDALTRYPLWRNKEPDTKSKPLLLKMNGLKKFLGGRYDTIDVEHDCVKRETLTANDNRVGIRIDQTTLTSEEGQIYGIGLLSMRPKSHNMEEVCLYAEIQLPSQIADVLTDTAIPFGGEGKYVRVRKLSRSAFAEMSTTTNTSTSMWYLATPTFAPKGKSIPQVNGLVAAASGAGISVSGWDVARNAPRPTRFAIPAGAVYFMDQPTDASCFLNGDDESESADLRQEGWGFALPGTWGGLK